MIKWVASLLFLFSISAHALSADDFVARFAKLNGLERADEAFELCTTSLASWPSANYQNTVARLGTLWLTQPEAAFYALDTCQAKWIKKFLNPNRLKETRNENDRAKFADNLAQSGLIGLPRYLREQIRLHNSSVSASPSNIPPSPYEILSGMASNERELDTAIHYESSHAQASMAGMLGGTAISIALAVREFSLIQTGRLAVLGRAYAGGNVLAVAGLAFVAGTQWYIDHKREQALWAGIDQSINRLSANPNKLEPWVLDNFFASVTNLSFQYSHDVYLKNSGDRNVHPTINPECKTAIESTFAQLEGGLSWGWALKDHELCADPVMVWVAASNYLSVFYPKSQEAQQISERLMALAKKTYLSYRESEAYSIANPPPPPPCDPLFPPNMQGRCAITL